MTHWPTRPGLQVTYGTQARSRRQVWCEAALEGSVQAPEGELAARSCPGIVSAQRMSLA